MQGRERIVTARMVRRGADERAFDREFWRGMTPEARLEAMWDMVIEADLWKGGDGRQPRLQRSVCRFRRR